MNHSLEPLSVLKRVFPEQTLELQSQPQPQQELTSPTDAQEEELTYPEGGLTANLVLFGSFMGLIPAFGLLNAVGSIEAYVSSHQLSDIPASTVSWIFSIYMFVTFGSQLFSGAFFDRKGSFKPMLIGTISLCTGLLITANCSTVYQFVLSFGILVGFGNGMMVSPLIGVVSHYFNEKRGVATSIATAGGSIGGIIMSIMLKELYTSVGFQWSMRIMALFSLVFCVISLVFAKERFKQDEQPIDSWGQFFKSYFLDLVDLKYFKDVRFVLTSMGLAFGDTGIIVSGIYFPSYALKRGFSSDVSYFLVTVVNAANIFGRYIPAYFADRHLGRFNVCTVMAFMSALTILIVWLPFGQHVGALYAFAALYGFFSGSLLSLSPVCIGQVSRTEEFGKRFSTAYLLTAFCMLACIPIGGVVIGDGSIERYTLFNIYGAMLFVLSSLGYFVARHMSVGARLVRF